MNKELKLKVGDKVKVVLHDTSQSHEDIDVLINGATGTVSEINNFIYPYIVKLDNLDLQELITDCPRQFDDLELVKI